MMSFCSRYSHGVTDARKNAPTGTKKTHNYDNLLRNVFDELYLGVLCYVSYIRPEQLSIFALIFMRIVGTFFVRPKRPRPIAWCYSVGIELKTNRKDNMLDAIQAITKSGGSSLLVHYAVSFDSNFERIFPKIVINDLVIVRCKLVSEIDGDKGKLSISFSLIKHEKAKDVCIKANVASPWLKLKYSEVAIQASENWSEWKYMGTLTCAKALRNGYMTLYDLLVTVYESKIDTMSSKLYTDTDFTDFFLAAGENKVPVHKSFMIAHSDVFKTMLSREWKETVEGQIKLPGVTIETLQHLKEYMYLGTVPETGLRPLLLIARCYLIEDLEKHCIRKLAETVKAKDLFSLIEFAGENHIPQLPFAILQITPDCVVNEAHRLKNKEVIEKLSK